MGEGLPQGRVLVAMVLVNLGLAGIVGAWASLLWLRVAASPWARGAQERSWAALRATLSLTVVADALLLWMQAAYMAEVPLPDAVATLPSMAWQTYAGHAWTGGVVGLLLVGVASLGTAPRRGFFPLAVAALGIGVFVYSRAAVSHAGDRGLASVALLVDCLHLWAISLWLGVVGVAAFVVLRAKRGATTDEEKDVAHWIVRLSSSATWALGVIALTGIYNAWHGIGSPSHLVNSPYGNALLVKVGFVAIAVALGAFNRLRVMPGLLAVLQTPLGSPLHPQHRFVQVLCFEAVALLAALIAAAILGANPLPTTI